MLWAPLAEGGGVFAQDEGLAQDGGLAQDWGLVQDGGLTEVVGRAQQIRFAGSRATAAFDAGFYHVRLDADVAWPGVIGWTTVQGTVVSGLLDSLALDFSTNMTVDSVRSNGAAVSFRHDHDVLTLALAESHAAGERINVDVFYHGLPGRPGFGTFEIGVLSNGDPYVWTLSEPYGAREWWPSKDHPSDKADSVRVTVTVPDPMRVGSNGMLRSEIDNGNGTRTFDWFSGYPISTYLVSIAAGVYDVYEQMYHRPDSLADHLGPLDLPILHYAYAGSNVFDGTGPLDGWRHVVDILSVQEYWFGAYPFPAEKYGHAQFTRGGGMEHQTMSSMGGAGVGLVAHELAHQWFGDAVTMETWPHLWLNEGFATYAELLTWKAREHLSPGTYASIFHLYYDRALRAQGTLLLQDTTSVHDMFSHPRIYSKGGIVLHMLRGVVGDEVFRDILRTYAAGDTLQYGNATTGDFRRVAEHVSRRDLDLFFRQWVTEGTGYPVYDVRWFAVAAGDGYDVLVDIRQTQEEPLSNVPAFVMPVPIEVRTSEGSERFVVMNDRRVQSFAFRVAAEPTVVTFDPDRMILREAAVNTSIERPRIDAAFEVFPNPARNVLHVRSGEAGRAELYDLTGRRIKVAVLVATAETDVLVSDVAPGTYFLRISTPGATIVKPVVILP